MKLFFVIFIASLPAVLTGAPFPADQIEFFETSVRPVLAENCVECHGAQRAESDLRLDHREGALKGVEAGLLRAIRHEGEADGIKNMPNKRAKLPAESIAAIEHWVELGLPWPDKVAIKPVRDPLDHWSFNPLNRTEIPADAGHPIDYFIRQQLLAKKLEPAPEADRQTLVRRLYFDLIGLPPTFEQMQSEVDQAIDELLASPHYGERWARHWLDVARYSDVKGYEAGGRERRFIYSYTYRDWVIRALNADLPYDQFVLHQLAAEQLAAGDDKSNLAAMGFLTLAINGRREIVIDDEIDTTFRGLMGLTVSCARCHDHKFDPIPTRDYYGIYSIFNNSIAPAEAPLIGQTADSPEFREFEAGLANVEKAVDEFLNPKLVELAKEFPELAQRPTQLETKLGPVDKDTLRDLRTKVDNFVANSPHAPDRALILEDRNPPAPGYVFVRGNPSSRGENVERKFLSALAGDDAKPFTTGSGRLELAKAIVDPDNPLTARVIVNRVWAWHFGEGLVSTPSDFGRQGEAPTHPELLDWLAGWFVENGWSLKKLHRLILTSKTWRQSNSHPNASQQLLVDSENRLLWRANRQRVNFEQMRDSILAVSGALDPKMFGRGVEIEDPPYPPRRTVYAFVDRQNLPAIFATFDFASPQAHTPRRAYTTIPTQALFTMNHPFLYAQAQKLLAHAEVEKLSTPDEKIEALYKKAFGRKPDASELATGKSFIRAQVVELKTDPLRQNKQTATVWQYGHGKFDPDAGASEFAPFPHFAGKEKRWQAGPEYPLKDSQLSYSAVHAAGGHPGNDENGATVIRWTAPEDVTVSVTGVIEKKSPEGDPVRARIVKNGQQLLIEVVCQSGASAPVHQAKIELNRGDTLDFRVDQFVNSSFDSYSWAPVIRNVAKPSEKWAHGEDFSGPDRLAMPWEIYAQALLSTNEFVFVD